MFLSCWEVVLRRQEGVQAESYYLLDQTRNHPVENWGGGVQGRIALCFHQPHPVILVHEVIQGQQLEIARPSLGVYFSFDRFEDGKSHLLHFGDCLAIEGILRMFIVQKLLKICIGQFISRLKFTIIITLSLNRIIGKMHVFLLQPLPLLLVKLIFKFLGLRISTVDFGHKCKIFARCSDIPLPVPKSFEFAIDAGQQHEMSDIEFSVVIEERSLNVGLHDESTFLVVFVPSLFYSW